jgi:hypothetical protein
MKSFIIFFEEKEGTSPLVRLLNNFRRISVVHQVENSGWEPFDRHNCGPMSVRVLSRCLDRIFGEQPVDLDALNAIYTRTSRRPLAPIEPGCAVGFKMRFQPPTRTPIFAPQIPGWNRVSSRFLGERQRRNFKHAMFDLLRRHGVFVFMAVRQDILRWGLSKYHGDGSGGKGHMQFKLASGQISRDEIGRIHVDCERLGRIIDGCERSHVAKRSLMDEFESAGIQTAPLRYEEFLTNKSAYFARLCKLIDLDITSTEISTAIEQGSFFEKVHTDDISEFVENHAEVREKFGDRFVGWPSDAEESTARVGGADKDLLGPVGCTGGVGKVDDAGSSR